MSARNFFILFIFYFYNFWKKITTCQTNVVSPDVALAVTRIIVESEDSQLNPCICYFILTW